MQLETTIVLFFFNDTATTEIYTLSLHDALPILSGPADLTRENVLLGHSVSFVQEVEGTRWDEYQFRSSKDRKSTRLNSSHANISYAVFCLKKKKNNFK